MTLLIVDDLVQAGEFSIDLYTMPDLLTNKIMEYLVSLVLRRWFSLITLSLTMCDRRNGRISLLEL